MTTIVLAKTVRNKIVKDKEVANSIYVDGDVSFSLNTNQCNCADSSFFDPHHKHMAIYG